GLVERVVGKVVDILIDGLGRLLRDAVCHAARNVPLRIAVEECLPLLLDLGGLFLGDGPAHHVRLPQRVSRQLLEDLDHLLLVDDAPVGDGED
ncbi:S-layer-like y domain-containing protein, partial [Dysosmobacter welbionis]